MSASSVPLVDHVTPSVPLASRAQPTSLERSLRCAPAHSLTSDGQRVVVPPDWMRNVEPETVLHGEYVPESADAPLTGWPAGL